MAQFVRTTENTEGLEVILKQEENSLSSLLGSEGAPIVVEVKGEELDEISAISGEVMERITGIPESITSGRLSKTVLRR